MPRDMTRHRGVPTTTPLKTLHDFARAEDAERQALLEAHGERVIRVTWKQATEHPRQTIARLRAAGAPVRP